jgi:hypothetical protein
MTINVPELSKVPVVTDSAARLQQSVANVDAKRAEVQRLNRTLVLGEDEATLQRVPSVSRSLRLASRSLP